MSLTNKERVGRSIELLRTALGPHVRRELAESYGDRWHEHVRAASWGGRTLEASLEDVGVLLKLVLTEWSLFAPRFQGIDKGAVQTVRDARNQWAHLPQESFTSERSIDVLGRIEKILTALGADSDAALVRYEASCVTDATVGEPDSRLRAVLIDTASTGQTFGTALRRGRLLGLSSEEITLATKALRASQLLQFDDPLTESSLIDLVH